MATTRIIPMHVNKGKTIAQCLTERTDYAKNPDKTEDGEYISAYACDAKTADSEFLLSKRQYRQLTGREQASDVIAYQIRQSFKPGEVTPDEANQLGYEFARRFTKGDHAFIVCTHTDKQHIRGLGGELPPTSKGRFPDDGNLPVRQVCINAGIACQVLILSARGNHLRLHALCSWRFLRYCTGVCPTFLLNCV